MSGHGEGSVRVALVHDYLTQYGGAERVLETIHAHFPEAPIFTSLLHRPELPPTLANGDIRPSFINRIPGSGSRHRWFTPVYPLAFRALSRQLDAFDLIIADSSAWAHHLTLRPNQALVCYCHSPARFLYGDEDYLGPTKLTTPARMALSVFARGMTALDRRAAQRVDRFLANSQNVARRVQRVYGREARVVYPPIDLDRFAVDPTAAPEDWFLIVSRLVPHKWARLAVDAATRANLPLKVIGDGRARPELEALAGPSIEFLGQRGDVDVIHFMRRCRALILPGAEDFGMTAVEAQAVGRPVIAYGKGGALESVVENETGLFFTEQTADSLLAAIERFASMRWDPARARANAEQFGVERFLRELDEEVALAISAVRSAAARP
jgi:glycosyltransferase involved in cell wall biosynthesis